LDDPASVFDDHVSRTVPIFSVDSKLFFDREFSLFGKAHVQTLEPRIFYVLTPHVGQDDIPHFDSGLYQVSFRNLFHYNRYAGRDRVGDANQVTLALTTRALDAKDGRETFRFSIGQIFYFRDREVTLAGSQPEEARDRESEIVAEAAMDIGGDLSARGTIHWEPDESRAERAAVNLRYRPRFDTVLNLGYSFRRLGTDVKQTDVSLRWPVTDRWTVVGRWNYSLREKESLETIWGVEYESCCWGARLVGRRFLLGTNEFSEPEYENGIFAQVHFRGLGGFGQDATSLLRRGISGYADPFD
jgi:LPS-assembly protein